MAPLAKGKLTIVIKLGTSSIVEETTHEPLLSTLSLIAEVTVKLRRDGHRVILVSSGAIGLALRLLDLPKRPKQLSKVQALAALGQCKLMALWEDLFAHLRQPIAQILLTRTDIADLSQYRNAQNTIQELMSMGIVPVVNENDTISVSEIKFGDNDTLSAITAAMVQADYLFLMTDVDCLYDRNPRVHADAKPIEVVHDIGALEADVSTSGSSLGTGGMGTKIVAARLATSAGVATIITRSSMPGNIYSIIEHIHAQNLEMLSDDEGAAPDKQSQKTMHLNHLSLSSQSTTSAPRMEQSPALPQTPGFGPGMATLDYLNSPAHDGTPESSLESLSTAAPTALYNPSLWSSPTSASARRAHHRSLTSSSSIAPTSTTFYPSGLTTSSGSAAYRDSLPSLPPHLAGERPLTFSMTNGVFKRMFSSSDADVPLHTRFLPNPNPIRDRYFWLLHGLAPHGTLFIDAAAHQALIDSAGLLPSGVVNVEGLFNQQEAVRLMVVPKLPAVSFSNSSRDGGSPDADRTPRQASLSGTATASAASSRTDVSPKMLKPAPKSRKVKAGTGFKGLDELGEDEGGAATPISARKAANLEKAAEKMREAREARSREWVERAGREKMEKKAEPVEIGRAIVNYSAVELGRIKGLSGKEIASVLGYCDSEFVAVRENVALLEHTRKGS